MTTFTPRQFAVATSKFEKLQDGLPASAIPPLAEEARKILAAASHSSPGVKATESEFRLVRPTAKNGYASARIVGRGFAILDEYGSYKQPAGYDIDPSFTFNASTGVAKQGRVLADGKGFFAAYVHHPPIKAHPYVTKATIVIEKAVDATFEKATSAIILAAFR